MNNVSEQLLEHWRFATVLVYCCMLGGAFSEPLAGQTQGAFRREWCAL